jgi:hypothetical protein
MFKAIKEFFVGKTPAERHPLDAVTTPNIPEPVMFTETVVVMEPPKEQMIPIPFVPEAAPAKAPRKPRAPKAAPVAAVKEKAPAKARAPKSKKV